MWAAMCGPIQQLRRTDDWRRGRRWRPVPGSRGSELGTHEEAGAGRSETGQRLGGLARGGQSVSATREQLWGLFPISANAAWSFAGRSRQMRLAPPGGRPGGAPGRAPTCQAGVSRNAVVQQDCAVVRNWCPGGRDTRPDGRSSWSRLSPVAEGGLGNRGPNRVSAVSC